MSSDKEEQQDCWAEKCFICDEPRYKHSRFYTHRFTRREDVMRYGCGRQPEALHRVTVLRREQPQ